ncbi:MAG: histidine kinase [Alistipes sp.]|jgi:sensor histidine kinase YesM|nr:histidine kinase [Alistipes sp.]
MRNNYMTYGMAAKLSLVITVALFVFFLLLNLYFRGLPGGAEGGERLMVRDVAAMLLYGPFTQFVLLFILFSINFRVLRGEALPRGRIAAGVAATILFAIAYSVAVSMLRETLFPPDGPRPGPGPMPFMLAGIVKDVFLATFVIFISQILYLTQKRRQVERRNDQLEAENLRTRYLSLKNQVNPHFLFNTLSTLDAIVAVDPSRAREYIQKFSSVFRYTLRNNDTVTLADELDFVRNYADLMQIRHGNSLRIEFAVDNRWGGCLLVPMAVQSLVENAIKHNSFSESSPLIVSIETTSTPELVVSNPYRPKEYPEAGEGVGLANLAERYRLKWRREIAVSNADGFFRVSLPLIPPQS